MIAIAFRFIGGSYHATPWGHHVNEGVPEWPPAPWRILRALIAVRYRTLPPDTPERSLDATLTALLSKLSDPPRFALPPATLAHTRHFVPWEKKGPEDRTRIFDTFVALDRDAPVVAVWPGVELTPEEHDLLRQLVENLPYLGRAESWCRASLVRHAGTINCAPRERESLDAEPVRVLVPAHADPDRLLAALVLDVNQVRTRDRLRNPPLSRWLVYDRPRDCLAVPPSAPTPTAAGDPEATVARYVLDGRPRPLLVHTLRVAELARRAVLAQFGRQNNRVLSPTLLGKDEKGEPLRGHAHAHYLPTDEDGDGFVDHLTIFAPSGFSAAERRALASLRELVAGGVETTLSLLFLGVGAAGDFAPLPWLGCAAGWRSVTPYVLNRHPKVTHAGVPKLNEEGRQIDGPEDQVRREWESRRAIDRSLPPLSEVEAISVGVVGGKEVGWWSFVRRRARGTGKEPGPTYGFRLRFAEPAKGPIALGYGSHFGLGLFVPDSPISPPRPLAEAVAALPPSP